MIKVSVEPLLLVAGRRTQLAIRFANTGQRACSDVVFQFRLPSSIKLISGTNRADIPVIPAGRDRTHNLTVEPSASGVFELTSPNFSYRDENDWPVRVTDFRAQLKVGAAPAPAAQARRPPARMSVEHSGGALALGEWDILRIVVRNTTGIPLTDVRVRISGPLKTDGKLARVAAMGVGAAARFPFSVNAAEGGRHVPVGVHTTYSYPDGQGSVRNQEQDDRVEIVVARPAEPDASPGQPNQPPATGRPNRPGGPVRPARLITRTRP